VQREAITLSNEATPGERAAFEQLYMAHAETVRRHLVYLTGDRPLAEDLAQETFSKLYQQASMADVRNPKSWLLTVASNLAYNHFRAESRRTAREQAHPGGRATSQDTNAQMDDVIDVRRVLGELDPRDRAVLMLRHSGLTYAEVAEAVGVSATSVGTILSRAQMRFRSVYEGKRRTGAEKE
jgi:RNA polymerase sigma factor (sigma-70 family)